MRIEIDQNTEEWLELRLGKITGSEVKDLMVKGKKKDSVFGVGALTYISTKATEILTGCIKEQLSNTACQWGNDHEDEAVYNYEQLKFTSVENGGFYVLDGNGFVGCSPDGVVDAGKGIIEVKCPYNSVNHFKTLKSGVVPKEYLYQVLHNTYVVGAEWCDFISYDPRFKDEKKRMVVIRVNLSDYEEQVCELKERTTLAIEMIQKEVE